MKKSLFETGKLLVRQLTADDMGDFFDMQGNPRVMKYIKPTLNYEESKEELHRLINYYDAPEINFNIWAVINKEDNQFTGICGVYFNKNSEYEIAYRFREKFWGKGYGKEIALALIKYCFNKMQLKEIVAFVSKANIASLKILEKEMSYVEEVYSDKINSFERKYKLNKEDWLKNSG